MKIKALGKTIEHNGEVVLVADDMPVDCMVLFVDMQTWAEIKDDVTVGE